VLSILVIVGILDLVEIVLVELANEGSKIGVLEHARKDGLCKLVHILEMRQSDGETNAESQNGVL
jgi:hypothetical protein